ncbi:MAG: penicillin-binding transpeptidase domain-containing protein, partial [Patescibacteria group bacterium]
RFAISLIKAQRGVIYDKDLIQLVFNKPEFDFVCDGQVVSENLNHQDLIFYEVKINEYEGCAVENNTARDYLAGPVFSQVIVYQRKTGGKTGLEDYYDGILKAKPGEVRVARDVYGNPLSKEIVSQPISGQSLVLYLDAELQEKVVLALEKTIKSTGARGASAVALDPKTGGVLALASLPSFDNNLFSQGITQEQWNALEKDPKTPLFNRAISGVGYPSGSTIKPLIGLAALEEKVIKPETQIYSPLEICIQNPWYPDRKDCYADWKYHGQSDLKRAIAESVNTFFYQVGGGYEKIKGLGATKIKKWLEIFNWGSKTGIDLPKEGEGILPDLANDWRLG